MKTKLVLIAVIATGLFTSALPIPARISGNSVYLYNQPLTDFSIVDEAGSVVVSEPEQWLAQLQSPLQKEKSLNIEVARLAPNYPEAAIFFLDENNNKRAIYTINDVTAGVVGLRINGAVIPAATVQAALNNPPGAGSLKIIVYAN